MTELYIQTINNKKEIALVENEKLIEYYEEEDTIEKKRRKYIYRNCKRYYKGNAISFC